MIWFLAIFMSVNVTALDQVRELFSIASNDEVANNRLLSITKDKDMINYPTLYGYNAAGTMLKANHAVWPMDKLNYFSEGKEQLEKVIEIYPQNVELRFIRYNIQKNSPGFLKYNQNLKRDSLFILTNIEKTGWSNNFKQKVKKSVKGI